ncbi:MAG: adenylate/guanylate cyclase domain-containing protein [Anaerolineales bacterium]|nr:adenylate/guanylate cyclase domain-containing protein [Anaerolineales bacterium]
MTNPEQFVNDPIAEKVWHTYMTTGKLPDYAQPVWFENKYLRPFVRLLPSDPRCRWCYYPFQGIGGKLSRMFLGVTPSKLNPQLCNVCERTASKFPGGTEIEVSVLFADVRGSTTIAEKMSPAEFSYLIDSFYKATTKVLFKKKAFVEKLIGDEVTGFFVPGFAGNSHASLAVEAGEDILRATGHDNPKGPWIPVGVGVHTGIAFVGAVSSDGGGADITVLGDTANAGARLTSQAATGEIVLSNETRISAGINTEGMEARHLKLKGRTEEMDVWVKTISASKPATQ